MAAAKYHSAPTVIEPANSTADHIICDNDQHGLIILGNSGVGKSFLANILLGQNAFVHEFSPSSVTHITEYQELDLGYDILTIFNIPGLIEAQQERIDLNKIEIDKAFALRPNSIVVFVFGQTGGRIREEDMVAFNAINKAYPFQPESLVLVVNGLPKERPPKYEGSTLVLLQHLLEGFDVNTRNLCFLDHISANNPKERQHLKEQLLQVIVEFQPSLHQKKREIETVRDQLKEGARQIRAQHVQFEEDREKYMKQIEDGQRVLSQTIANHRSETESLQRAMENQERLYAEQQRRFEEENRQHQAQLQDLRERAELSQRNYDMLLQSNEATQQQIRTCQETNQELQKAYQELQKAYQALLNQPKPSPPRKRRWYETALDIVTQVVPVVKLFK